MALWSTRRERTEPDHCNGVLLTPPGAVAKPHRMMRMPGTRGPGRIDKGVVQVLLNILDDLVDRVMRLKILERDSREAADFGVVFGSDSRQDIAAEEADDPIEVAISRDHRLTCIEILVSAERRAQLQAASQRRAIARRCR